MATLEMLAQEHPAQQPAGTGTPPTLTYSLAFDPGAGAFWLFEEGNPLPPMRLEMVVTKPGTTIVLNAVPPLVFSASPALTWLTVNTPSLAIPVPPNSPSSVSFTMPTPPGPSDVFGFWLSMSYGSPSPFLFNLTTPYFFVTAGKLEAPASITLTYDTTSGVFAYGDSAGNALPLQKLEVFYRLGYQQSAAGTPVPVMLVSTPVTTATFADPAILWSDGTTTPRDGANTNLVTLACPFVSGRGLGMQFVVEYEGATINSPDPIIMDKQIGDNGQP